MCVLSCFSCVWLFVTRWIVAHQAPLSIGFSRQEYWSGCCALLQGTFLIQGSNLSLLNLWHWQGDSLPLGNTWEVHRMCWNSTNFTAHTKIQLFFLFTISLECWSHWLISRALKSWLLQLFVSIYHCFYGGENFNGPSLFLLIHHFCWCLQCSAKSWLIGKDPDAGRDWVQEEKGTTEDEMAGWHHQLDGHGFGWTLGVGDGQGGLACCDSWGCKGLDTTEQLNWTALKEKHTLEEVVLFCCVIISFGLKER